MNKILLVVLGLLTFSFESCKSELEQVLELSGNNRPELERVLLHYDSLGELQKRQAAEYLIVNMVGKYGFGWDKLACYDTLFSAYSHIWQAAEEVGDSEEVKALWKEITQRNGGIKVSALQKNYDLQQIQSGYLIEQIDLAFEGWEKSPMRKQVDFERFCRYVLPYRVGNEPLESFRRRYLDDTTLLLQIYTTPQDLLAFFELEIHRNRRYQNSDLLWDFPMDFPVSKMELARRGACRHLVNFYASVMRARGIPVAVDRAVWANRSQGHTWNVLMLDSNRIHPFDALSKRKLKMVYKPAKVFRNVFDVGWKELEKVNPSEVPAQFFVPNEIDVTDQYVQAYDIALDIRYKPLKGSKDFGVICVFDNKGWRPVHWGKISWGKMRFKKMAPDVLYLAAYYEDGEIVPATDPFVLKQDGTICYCSLMTEKLTSMKLERKYPLLDRIRSFAGGIIGSKVEGADRADFRDADSLLLIRSASFIMTDSLIRSAGKYRYVRLHSDIGRRADYGEVQFFGKRTENEEEELLEGKIIGCPSLETKPNDSYLKAMDGDLETFFSKSKGIDGWVGLDLGRGNERIITRIRFCPRSDTNFVIPGDEYELFYWDKNTWRGMGRKIAADYFVEYMDVPSGGLYLLSNYSRGEEERVFTWQDGQQVWW